MHDVLARRGPIGHIQVGALNFHAENNPERPIHALSNYRRFDELVPGQRGEVRSMTLGNDEHVTPVDRVTIVDRNDELPSCNDVQRAGLKSRTEPTQFKRHDTKYAKPFAPRLRWVDP